MNIYDMDPRWQDLVSLADAAKMLNVDESTIRKAIARGAIKEGQECAKFGKQWVLHSSAIRALSGNLTAWSEYRTAQLKEYNAIHATE